MKRLSTFVKGLGILLALLFLSETAQAKVGARLILVNPNLQVVRIGDLDFSKTGPKRNLFYLILFNDGNEPVPVRLRFEIIFNSSRIASGSTNIFELPPTPPGGLRVTQQQLIDGVVPDGQGGFIRIRMLDYRVNADKIERLKNQVFATGRLPSGRYIFQIRVETNQLPPDQIAPPSRETLIIRNPSNVFLIYPGAPVSSPNTPEIPSTYPQLQWQSDANIFNLYVFEKRPEDRSVQDVLNHPPFLRMERMVFPPEQRQFFFQYPTTTQPIRLKNGGRSVGSIRLLQPGKVYYWFVEALVPTSSNDYKKLKSDVYKFRILPRNPQNAQGKQIVTMLQNVLGERGRVLFKKLMEEGYMPTGRVRVNGRPMTMEEFSRYLMQLQGSKSKIGRIEVN